jgi:DNA polymerase III alpha subunit (gram-positive type)
MNNAAYIALDLETGGLSPKENPILTGYFLALDENFNQVDELALSIIPNPALKVEESALKVNGINLELHNQTAVGIATATERLSEFIGKYSGKTRPRVIGHNVGFDLNFIYEQLISSKVWDKHIHYRTIDTSTITNFLKDCEILPPEVGSLESLVGHFKINALSFHDAKGDVKMCVSVYREFLKMMKSSRGSSDNMSLNLLEIIE